MPVMAHMSGGGIKPQEGHKFQSELRMGGIAESADERGIEPQAAGAEERIPNFMGAEAFLRLESRAPIVTAPA
jgi:hypothetical protein